MTYTSEQYQYLQKIYRFYNTELFLGELPEVLITFSRNNGASGLFQANKWKDKDEKMVHEIAINPESIKERFDVDFHQTLVHEMCHLWQYEFGKPSRSGYHNKEWANKMIEVGLMPTATGSPGGATVGQNMSDYFMEDGKFVLAYKKLQENNYMPLEPNNEHLYQKEISEDGAVVFTPITAETKGKKNKSNRLKYSCKCGNNIWGKPNLELYCNVCESHFFINN